MKRLATFAALCALSTPLAAQELPQIIQRMAVQNIHLAQCSETEKCARASDDELENPPLSDDLMADVLSTSMRSVMARVCGHDFNALSLNPFLDARRASGDHSEREMAIISLSHGIGMGVLLDRMPETCNDDLRAALKREGIE